jgi:23S rRNA-/tRNA-specific pseudouridylate synthase
VLAFYPHLDTNKLFASLDKEQKMALDFYAQNKPGMTKNLKRAMKMYQGFSLVELSPTTGRTHQIRVHLSHIHHPLVGEKVYSGNKRKLIDQVWCYRMFLHAKSLKIVHPRTKTELIFEAPLSDDLEKTLSFLITQ